jgi:hypothetical protein
MGWVECKHAIWEMDVAVHGGAMCPLCLSSRIDEMMLALEMIVSLGDERAANIATRAIEGQNGAGGDVHT